MARYTSYESAFHQLLSRRIEEMIVDKCRALGNGNSCNASDLAATGSAYNSEVAAIKALQAVLEVSQEIAKEMMKAG